MVAVGKKGVGKVHLEGERVIWCCVPRWDGGSLPTERELRTKGSTTPSLGGALAATYLDTPLIRSTS